MIVAKLSISYYRGTSFNRTSDLGTVIKRGDVIAGGGVVRGLGSHFHSKEDMLASKARDQEAARVYRSFRERFMTTTIDGLYMVPSKGVAKAFVDSLQPQGVDVRIVEFELTGSDLDGIELSDWGEKIKRQLSAVSLGRKKQTDEAGLKVLDSLADCPLMTEKTRIAVKGLVGLLKTAKINRSDFRKKLSDLNIEIATEQLDKGHEARVEEIGKQAAWAHAPVSEAQVAPQA